MHGLMNECMVVDDENFNQSPPIILMQLNL